MTKSGRALLYTLK